MFPLNVFMLYSPDTREYTTTEGSYDQVHGRFLELVLVSGLNHIVDHVTREVGYQHLNAWKRERGEPKKANELCKQTAKALLRSEIGYFDYDHNRRMTGTPTGSCWA